MTPSDTALIENNKVTQELQLHSGVTVLVSIVFSEANIASVIAGLTLGVSTIQHVEAVLVAKGNDSPKEQSLDINQRDYTILRSRKNFCETVKKT